ncbi:MAG: hypothetical protein ACFE7R_08780 [Candidatus Hodarchaeota archaeon]
MKKTLSLAMILLVIFSMSSSFTLDTEAVYVDTDHPFDNSGVSENSHTVHYDHWSIVTIVETITDLGGGTWKYSYKFTNTETDYIWTFAVYTTFDISTPTTFAEKSEWAIDILDIDKVIPIYDARNLDSAITWLIGTWPYDWTELGTTEDPISISLSVSGFSFLATVYDPSPKYYVYELHGNWGGNTGKVSAVGLTVPVVVLATIDELKAEIEEMGSQGDIDNQGIVRSLLAKLNVAQRLVDKGKIDEAIMVLEDFIPQVQELSGIHITPEAADILIQSAEYILSHL